MAQFAAAGRGGEKVGGVVIEVHYHPPAISAKKHRPIMVSPIFKTEAKTMGPENCPVSTLARRQKTSSHTTSGWCIADYWPKQSAILQSMALSIIIPEKSKETKTYTKTIPRSLVEVRPSCFNGANRTWTLYPKRLPVDTWKAHNFIQFLM